MLQGAALQTDWFPPAGLQGRLTWGVVPEVAFPLLPFQVGKHFWLCGLFYKLTLLSS
jgi:hypothetical protein